MYYMSLKFSCCLCQLEYLTIVSTKGFCRQILDSEFITLPISGFFQTPVPKGPSLLSFRLQDSDLTQTKQTPCFFPSTPTLLDSDPLCPTSSRSRSNRTWTSVTTPRTKIKFTSHCRTFSKTKTVYRSYPTTPTSSTY